MTREGALDKPVEVVQIVDPKFLTLTGLPANQIAFKVLRADEEKGAGMANIGKSGKSGGARSRVRSDVGGALLYFDFSAETEDSYITELMSSYGIPEGYEISVMEDGKKRVKCSDAYTDDTPTMSVTLGNGCKATVVRSVVDEPAAGEKPSLKVVALEFNKEKYANEVVVRSYLESDFVDLSKNTVENFDTVFRVSRSAMPEDTDMRRIEIVDGVVAVVVRAEFSDVPQNIATTVNEAAYGNYGWGQLDFAASMADVVFCDVVDEATYRLGSVLRNILFYSELPLSVRKDLVTKAALQYAGYIGGLIDSLPTQVVAVSRNGMKRTKEQDMSKEEVTKTAGAEVDPATQQVVMTRAELSEMITAAVAAASVPSAPGESGSAEVARADSPAQGDAAGDAVVAEVRRTIGELKELVEGVAARIDAVEASTVVRSDSADSDATTKEEKAGRVPFQGVFTRSITGRAAR